MSKEIWDYILWGSAILFWGYLIIRITWNVVRGIDYLLDLPLKFKIMEKSLDDYKNQMKYFYINEYEIKAAVNHHKEHVQKLHTLMNQELSKSKAKK